MEKIRSALNYKFGDSINMILRSLGCIILSMTLAWKFTIVFLCLVPLTVYATVKMIATIKKYTIDELKSYASAGQIAQEMLASVRTVLALGMEKRAVDEYACHLNEAETLAKKKGLYSGLFGCVATGAYNVMTGLGIYYAFCLVRSDPLNYSVATIMPAFFCIIVAAISFGQAFPFFGNLAEAKGAAKRVFELVDTKSAVDVFEQIGKVVPTGERIRGKIEFVNVGFSYPQRKDVQVLKGFSLKIAPGQTVAFVGSR